MARRSKSGKDYQTYKWFIDLVVTDLNLQEDTIAYRFRYCATMGGRATFGWRYDTHCIVISTSESRTFIPNVIAHELRHIWQHKHGLLVDRLYGGRMCYHWHTGYVLPWIVEDFIYNNDMRNELNEYEKLPWEADANEYAKMITTRYKDEINFRHGTRTP